MYICLNMPSALSPWWVGPAELQITSHAHTQTHTHTNMGTNIVPTCFCFQYFSVACPAQRD